jgi:hypothetical protein
MASGGCRAPLWSPAGADRYPPESGGPEDPRGAVHPLACSSPSCREPYVLPGISALAGLAMLLDRPDRAEHYRRADPHSSTNLPASEAPTTS